VNTDIIVARLRAMADNARCRECGSTVASCAEEEARDPRGPRRCCEQCGHEASLGAVRALAREVESGAVRTVEEATPRARAKKGMSWFEYLTQGEQWQPNGKPAVAIADMDKAWRYNAARYLERHAAVIGQRYSLAQTMWFAAVTAWPLGPSENAADSIEHDIDREEAEIARDPVAWIRTTKLHRALVTGLPTKKRKVAALAERARHWSACPARSGDGGCRCEALQQSEAGRTSDDTAPEWTLS
jgi:hypothetical protein